MPLTPDQRAMLQLLLERRQSYEDIGSLLGLSTDDVRARARAVLTEMAGQDPDAEVGLTDYLLGQADPIGRADVARHLQGNPEALETARGLVAQLQLLAPDAQLPELPTAGKAIKPPEPSAAAPTPEAAPAAGAKPPAEAGKAASPPSTGRLSGLRSWLGERRPRVLAVLLASTLLVVAIVLAVRVFGGDGDNAGSTDSKNIDEVSVDLTPPGGGKARGQAVFTNTGGQTNQIAFKVAAEGLEPSPADGSKTYTLWMYISRKNAYPLAPVAVGKDGKLSATRPIPAIFTSTETGLAVLARFKTIRLSLTPTKQLSALVSAAVEKQQPLVPYIGETALEGEIPGSVGPSGGQGSTGGAGAQGGAQTAP